MSIKTGLVSAAIDFGTTYSGYAYAFKDEFKKNPLNIIINLPHNAGEGLVTWKAPTVILFKPDGAFHSFGFEAEDNYAELAENDEHKGWRFFKRFKMMLFTKKVLSRLTTLRDDQGQPMKALRVFAAAIGFMKRDLMKAMAERKVGVIRETDINWVLTVPAIWNDAAKQFMREAASEAGIPGDQLTLALEPEAAAIYCKEVATSLERDPFGACFLSCFEAGAQFLIVDLGGGTVDITAHEVQRDATLVELVPPSGGPWGGTKVDDAFNKLLERIFTDDVMKTFTKDLDSKADDLDLQRAWELKKRAVSHKDGKVYLKLPTFLYELFKKHTSYSIEQRLNQDQLASTVDKKKGDKLHVYNSVFLEMFHEPVSNVKRHIQRLLRQPNMSQVNTVMLVGGFSDSEVVKTTLKKALQSPDLNVITPTDAGLAVLKGAVIYGFNPSSITSRKMRFTYGISTSIPFNDRIHPTSKKVTQDDLDKCEDIFKVFIPAGETVIPGKTTRSFTFNTPSTKSSTANVEVYKSMDTEPQFITDEGCQKVGEIRLDLRQSGLRMIDVTMSFGHTELPVEALELSTENRITAQFNFLR